jgi:hypothetical protein
LPRSRTAAYTRKRYGILASMLDWRRVWRLAMIRRARVVFERASLSCALLDLSPVGARVRLPETADLPGTVLLYLPDEITRAAWVRWRRGLQVGFEFLGPATPAVG